MKSSTFEPGLKIQEKNYFGLTHSSSKVHFRFTEGQTFYWSIMTVDDSIKCRFANSGVTGQVGGFQNPGVCLQAFPSFLPPPPPRSFTCAICRAVSLTLVPRSLHRNACYTGYSKYKFVQFYVSSGRFW